MVDFNTPVANVPLLKSVVEERRAFLPTESEWNARNSDEIIIRDAEFTNTTGVTLFGVPQNTTLFITSAWCTSIIDAEAGDEPRVSIIVSEYVGSASQGKIIGCASLSKGIGDVSNANSVAMNYSMPIKVNAGSTVELVKSTGSITSLAMGGFSGWLEKKKVKVI